MLVSSFLLSVFAVVAMITMIKKAKTVAKALNVAYHIISVPIAGECHHRYLLLLSQTFADSILALQARH